MNQTTATVDQGHLEDQIIDVLASTFNLRTADVPRDAAMGSVPQWDSLGHMQLIVALENAFDVTIPNFAVADLSSVPEIARMVGTLREGR